MLVVAGVVLRFLLPTPLHVQVVHHLPPHAAVCVGPNPSISARGACGRRAHLHGFRGCRAHLRGCALLYGRRGWLVHLCRGRGGLRRMVAAPPAPQIQNGCNRTRPWNRPQGPTVCTVPSHPLPPRERFHVSPRQLSSPPAHVFSAKVIPGGGGSAGGIPYFKLGADVSPHFSRGCAEFSPGGIVPV